VSALEVWGLDDVAETTYRAMLRNPEFSVDALAAHLELDRADVEAAVRALARVGLITGSGMAPGQRLTPASPATTLAALVHSELSDLEERRSRLDAVRASLAGFAADHMVGQSRAWASVPFELLSMDESFAAVEDIQRATTGEVLACHPVVDIDVDSPAYVELLEHQLGAGRAMRGLYPTEVLGDPQRLAYVRRWAAAGESVRLTQRVLPSVAVFGDEVALVNTRWSGDPSGTVLVRAPALVALVRALFDEYWARATPLPGREDVSDTDELGDVRVVLELLQLGMKDETIARQLGVSLRTVRRRIAALMDDLGVATRFQAGLEAARRGLI
jgi:predicted transcriptional regulator